MSLQSHDEQTIIEMTRKIGQLQRENDELKRAKLYAETAMRKVGVPSSFEDGNDCDDLSFTEQVSILCGMYERAKASSQNIEWKRPADEMPPRQKTVLIAFSHGEVLRGWFSDCWRHERRPAVPQYEQPVAWAHMPEAPECLLKICENPRSRKTAAGNLRKETEAR